MIVAMTTVEVICPSAKELMEQPRRNVPCTVEGCDKLLATTAALKMHVIKLHGIYKNKSERALFSKYPQTKSPSVLKHYFCPVEGCSRHKAGSNPFSNMWPLKQHYQQVHGERTHLCRKCDFPFAFDLQRRRHEKKCGTIFSCSCGVPFTTRQALSMHAMRKKHILPPKNHDEPPNVTSPRQRVNSKTTPTTETCQTNGNPPSVIVNKILTIPIPASKEGSVPHLIVTPRPLEIPETGTPAGKPPPRKQPKTQRFLLPKPTILSVARAAALHPATTQIVTINKGIVKSFPVSIAPRQPVKKCNRTSATQTPRRLGRQGNELANYKRAGIPPGSANPALLPGGDGSCNSQLVVRDLGINTHLNSSINCQTQTVVLQNSAHTQTPGDAIMREALMSAHIETPTRKHRQLHEPQQQQQQQQQVLQQELQHNISALNRHTQTSQPSYMEAAGCLPHRVSSVTPLPAQQPHYTVRTQTQAQFNTSSTSSCDVQTDSWLSSFAQVNDQSTLTDIAGVPSQTNLSVLDFLNLSNSETQTVISHSILDESTPTESISTQTSRCPASTTQTKTSIQTTTSDLQGPYMERVTPQSTMQTQTNIYGDLDAFLLNESHSQTIPGESLSEAIASCCQQTQTLTSPVPETDHRQTQTALPDLSLSNSDFLALDMYTQTVQQGHQGHRNSSLQTQTDPFLEYSLSSMQTQTMADFDLGAFDYQSISVQTDMHILDSSISRMANRTQVQTQTNLRMAGGDTAARHVQTESRQAEDLYNIHVCATSALTDSHTQTG